MGKRRDARDKAAVRAAILGRPKSKDGQRGRAVAKSLAVGSKTVVLQEVAAALNASRCDLSPRSLLFFFRLFFFCTHQFPNNKASSRR